MKLEFSKTTKGLDTTVGCSGNGTFRYFASLTGRDSDCDQEVWGKIRKISVFSCNSSCFLFFSLLLFSWFLFCILLVVAVMMVADFLMVPHGS